MTIGSGSVSSADVAGQLFNDSGHVLNTSDPNVERLVKSGSNVTFPDSFRQKGWGTQNNNIGGTTQINIGNSGNMRSHCMDRRFDAASSWGGTVPDADKLGLTLDRSYYGGWIFHYYNKNQTAPVAAAYNGYFVQRFPYTDSSGNKVRASVSYEANGTRGSMTAHFHLFGFSAGYLSGNRLTIAEAMDVAVGVSSGTFSIGSTTIPSGNPHIVVNMEGKLQGNGSGVMEYWNGAAS